MRIRFVVPLVALCVLVAALFSCTAEGGSIYKTIENEQKVSVSTLEQTLTIFDILKTGDIQFPYMVAAGAVYKGTVPDSNNVIGWPIQSKDPIAVSPPVGGALCLAMVNYAGAIYGGFFVDGPGMGLYKSTSGPNFSFRPSDGATYYADPLVAGKQITLLQVAGGQLFMVTAAIASGTSGFTYDLLVFDGTNFSPTGLAGLTDKITGVGLSAGTYYVTAGPFLYTGGSLATLTGSRVMGPFTVDTSVELRGVTVDSGYILIPASSGDVYYNNGVSWAKTGTSDTVNGRQVGFLTVSARVGAAGPGDVFLIGADGAGYYTLTTLDNTVTKFSDVTVTGLYAGAVRKILVDGSTVFMGTDGTGLWRAIFDPALGQVNSAWVHE